MSPGSGGIKPSPTLREIEEAFAQVCRLEIFLYKNVWPALKKVSMITDVADLFLRVALQTDRRCDSHLRVKEDFVLHSPLDMVHPELIYAATVRNWNRDARQEVLGQVEQWREDRLESIDWLAGYLVSYIASIYYPRPEELESLSTDSRRILALTARSLDLSFEPSETDFHIAPLASSSILLKRCKSGSLSKRIRAMRRTIPACYPNLKPHYLFSMLPRQSLASRSILMTVGAWITLVRFRELMEKDSGEMRTYDVLDWVAKHYDSEKRTTA